MESKSFQERERKGTEKEMERENRSPGFSDDSRGKGRKEVAEG